jgi:hypothetical protein
MVRENWSENGNRAVAQMSRAILEPPQLSLRSSGECHQQGRLLKIARAQHAKVAELHDPAYIEELKQDAAAFRASRHH